MEQLTGSTKRPACPDVGVVALVPDRWGPLWQPRHHVLTRLARYFHVVWMNPPRTWQQTLKGSRAAPRALPEDRPGFDVYDPDWWLPLLFRPTGLARWTFRMRLRRAANLLRRQGCQRLVLYLWRPDYAYAIDGIEHDASIYHIDDEYSFEPDPEPLPPEERDLIERVDRVIIHSPRLMEMKGGASKHSVLIPNGADCEAYAREQPEPADMAGIPGPRIGYSGFLKQQMDWPLLAEVAGRNPERSFVFVGEMADHLVRPGNGTPGDREIIEGLRARSNVWFLGGKPARELTAYPQHFDVCLLPYRLTGYTHCIYPMKLHEYLASGRPVISTRIRSMLDFEGIVELASDAAEWDTALDRCLGEAERGTERVRARQEVAREHDWDRITERVAAQMSEQLGIRTPSPGPPAEQASRSGG